MSRRHFSALLVVTLVLAAVIAFLIPARTAHEQINGNFLIENLASQINDVDGLIITSGGGNTPIHLDKGEQAWTIRELHHYPADWGRLKRLLASLAEAKIVEAKTSNPDYYSRLGVEDVSAEGGAGVLLEVAVFGETRGIIVGNDATARAGQYVRLNGNGQSALIDQALDVPREAISWVDREIVNISTAQVAELSIRHADGEELLIHKVSADDTDFVLDSLPTGRTVRSSWSVNSLANMFSMLSMDSLQPEPEPDTEIEITAELSLLTFSGLRLAAELFSLDERPWIRLDATGYEADEINQRVKGWIYRLPESKVEAMTTRLEQILEPNGQGTAN